MNILFVIIRMLLYGSCVQTIPAVALQMTAVQQYVIDMEAVVSPTGLVSGRAHHAPCLPHKPLFMHERIKGAFNVCCE